MVTYLLFSLIYTVGVEHRLQLGDYQREEESTTYKGKAQYSS